MATRTGFFHSNRLDENDTYYPLLSLGATGMNKTGVNADLKYEKKTLTIKNINTRNINGNDSSFLTYGSFPRIKPNFVSSSSDWSFYIDTLLDDTISVVDFLSGNGGAFYTKGVVDETDKLSSLIYEGGGLFSIVMTGFTDLLNPRLLFTDKYQHLYTQMVLSIALSLSIPSNRIQNVRDSSWTKVGIWDNVYDISIRSKQINSSIEKNVGSTRYIAVRVGTINAPSTAYHWEIYVKNVLVGRIQGTTPNEATFTYRLSSFAVIFDLGENVSDCVIKIIDKRTSVISNKDLFVDYVACYKDSDLVNATPVLLTSVPRFTDGVSEQKRRLLNDAREAVARTCRLMGLPVSYYELSEASTLMTGQNPLLTTKQQEALANEIINETFNFPSTATAPAPAPPPSIPPIGIS
jgi:hypothetical protein